MINAVVETFFKTIKSELIWEDWHTPFGRFSCR